MILQPAPTVAVGAVASGFPIDVARSADPHSRGRSLEAEIHSPVGLTPHWRNSHENRIARNENKGLGSIDKIWDELAHRVDELARETFLMPSEMPSRCLGKCLVRCRVRCLCSCLVGCLVRCLELTIVMPDKMPCLTKK